MGLKKGQTNSGSFKKGEHRNRGTEFKKGEHKSPKTEFRKGSPTWNKGKKWSKEIIQKFKKAHKGKKLSESHKRSLSETFKANPQLCHSWKGGITPINLKIRRSLEYRLWRKAVFERDNYTCKFCGNRGGRLNADHIKPFAIFPELRFSIDNGRTLCHECHKNTPTYGVKASKELFE